MADRWGVKVTGIRSALAQLEELQGRKLQTTVRNSLRVGAERHHKPAIAAAARSHDNSNSPWRRYPNLRKKGGPMSRKVTVRTIRTKRGEFAAVSTGPRTWYAHFVIQGTKRHVIVAHGRDGARAPTSVVRRMNKAHGAEALHFQGRYVATVTHPGARSDGFVGRAGRGKDRAVEQTIVDDINRRLAAAKRQARAVTTY